MNELYFKNILIADLQENKAKYVKFSKGINIITSTENHVGKSSLMKSLYYCLGAEVDYDEKWDKSSKLYIVTIDIDGNEYKIVRQSKKFAILQGERIQLLTSNVTKELSKFFEQIYNFSVYLPNKQTGRNEIAPPVFTYLPYYIDQDKGWGTEPYESFVRLDQYNKKDRKTSLYYHLNVYNKQSVNVLAKIDSNKEKIENLERDVTDIKIALNKIDNESPCILQADTLIELESSLEIPREKINVLVAKLGESRDMLQKLESLYSQYTNQLEIVKEYNKIKNKVLEKDESSNITCPNCGYSYDDDIYKLIRKQYSVQNEDFVIQQIELIIKDTSIKLESEKQNYIKLIAELNEEENKISATHDTFNQYIKYKGLSESIKNLQSQLKTNLTEIEWYKNTNKELNKELKKLTKKKVVDDKYSEFLKINLIKLGAWDSKYEGKLQLLNSLKGQGTLSNKIILAQYISLFMTMDSLKIENVIKLPFVVDSPRGKEPSKTSSEDILNLILKIKMMPQIILATMDFDDFVEKDKVKKNIIRLTEKKSLLNTDDYEVHKKVIKTMNEILIDVK